VNNSNTRVSQYIIANKDNLAREIVERQWARYPHLHEKYGPVGRERGLQDVKYHLSYMAEAIAAGSPDLFTQYMAWAKVLLTNLNIPLEDLQPTMEITQEVLHAALPEDQLLISQFVLAGINTLTDAPLEIPSFLNPAHPLGKLAGTYLDTLLAGDRRTAAELIRREVEAGTSVSDIYLHVFQPTQQEIGRLWQLNQVSVAQEHYITAATQMIMSQLYPNIFSTSRRGRRLVAACIGGEIHEIGIRMVADFFEMDGWDTYYLGANTPTHSIVETTEKQQADVLAISATMTFYVSAVRELVEQVKATGRQVKILVGGYPFNSDPTLWYEIGASGYARNAQEAIRLANQLVDTTAGA
jgi:methanogenic corrinoid protein MtbC1